MFYFFLSVCVYFIISFNGEIYMKFRGIDFFDLYFDVIKMAKNPVNSTMVSEYFDIDKRHAQRVLFEIESGGYIDRITRTRKGYFYQCNGKINYKLKI